MPEIKLQLLEWSDTRLWFKIREIEDNIPSTLDYDEFDDYLLIFKFSDDSILEVKWEVDDVNNRVNFDIFSENTADKEWSFTADMWGIKWAKKVRFNTLTIKWKVLNSVSIPDVLQNNWAWTSTDNNLWD